MFLLYSFTAKHTRQEKHLLGILNIICVNFINNLLNLPFDVPYLDLVLSILESPDYMVSILWSINEKNIISEFHMKINI